MAFTPLIPGTLTASLVIGLGQALVSAPILNAAGTAINFSAWTGLTAELSAPAPGPNTAPVTFGTVTGASTGVITIEQLDTDFATASPGTAFLRVFGKPTSGDTNQLILTGNINLSAQ